MLRSRRGEAPDLAAARQVVSRAERSALDRAEQLRREAEELLAAARASAAAEPPEPAGPVGPAGPEAAVAGARDEAVTILSEAAREAENLLTSAMAAIERDTAIAKAEREKAEWQVEVAGRTRAEAETALGRARAEADAIVGSARTQAERILRDARARAAAELEDAKRRFAEETAGLRAAMDQTRSTLERYIGAGKPSDEAPPGD